MADSAEMADPEASATGGQRPTLVVISGRPGAGKSTVARTLATALACPLVSRDEINEGIFHTFDHDVEQVSKEQVAKLAFDTFFQAITMFVSADVTFVAEAAFQDFRWRVGLEPLLPAADIRIVHCTIDPELASQRWFDRRLRERAARRTGRERAEAAEESAAPPALRPFEPLSLPVPTMQVDTTDGYDPGLDEVLHFILAPPAAASR